MVEEDHPPGPEEAAGGAGLLASTAGEARSGTGAELAGGGEHHHHAVSCVGEEGDGPAGEDGLVVGMRVEDDDGAHPSMVANPTGMVNIQSGPAAAWTRAPATHVSATVHPVPVPRSTTRSARRPGARRPRSCSWPPANAAPAV